jgi:hypothetical protein
MKILSKLLSLVALLLSSMSYSMERPASPTIDVKSLFPHDELNKSTPYKQLEMLKRTLQKQARSNDVEGMRSTFSLIKELHLIEGPWK